MASIVMAYIVMAYIVMVYILMAPGRLDIDALLGITFVTAVGFFVSIVRLCARARARACAFALVCVHVCVHVRGGGVRGGGCRLWHDSRRN